MKEQKTNAMRILEREGVPYTVHTYECSEFIDGVSAANAVGMPCEQVFKTLVTVASDGEPRVFVIPCAEELDLKAAARAAGVKSVEMLPLARLTATTGYIRGACSPVGMKKLFPTFVDETAELFDTVCVSGGKWGLQLEVCPDALLSCIGAKYAALTA